MKKKQLNGKKGITLISLVITVIVLLILAAVTINLTIGHNGIFKRAQEAKTSYEKESLLEEMRLAMLDKKLEKGADLTNADIVEALGKFGDVQQNEDGTVTGVKPNGGGDDDVITFEEIENGETGEEGADGGSGGSTGPSSGMTNAELAALRGEVTSLSETANTNKSDIESLKAEIKSLQDSLTATGGTNEQVAALQSKLEALESKVESQESTSASKLASIETRLSKAEQSADATSLLNRMYPVGSIFISTNLKTPKDVGDKLGGTWEIYGNGRTLVGLNNGEQSGTTGGNVSGKVNLSVNNLPSHMHIIPKLNVSSYNGNVQQLNTSEDRHFILTTAPDRTLYYKISSNSSGDIYCLGLKTNDILKFYKAGTIPFSVSGQTTTASETGSAGNGESFSILDPFITVFFYKRII